jgi:hypothetical protein
LAQFRALRPLTIAAQYRTSPKVRLARFDCLKHRKNLVAFRTSFGDVRSACPDCLAEFRASVRAAMRPAHPLDRARLFEGLRPSP